MRNKKAEKQILALTVTSVMVAMSVVFCRFIGFSAEGTPFRFELGFLPIAFIGYMQGPVYAGLGYLVADIIGSLFSGYAPNLWISLGQFASGAIFGLFFHKKNITLTRTILTFSIVAVLIDFLFKTPVLVIMYGWTWGSTFIMRGINAAINLVIRVAVYYLFARLLKQPMDDLSKKLQSR